MTTEAATITVVGAGAWGTALALSAVRAGHQVNLLARDPAKAAEMQQLSENRIHLPGVSLPDSISVLSGLDGVRSARAVILAVPAQATRDVLTELADLIGPDIPVVLTAKGFEQNSGLRLSQVAENILPKAPLAVLSGPSFAADVARGMPTAVTLACTDMASAEDLARMFAHPAFRLYASDDVIGAEMGGALKNVLAIACGIVEGRSLGASARAALTTRGFAELQRFALAHGARAETLHGLSGLGDLILTCSSRQSRNFAYGMALGSDQAQESVALSEGRFTARAVTEMAARHNVEMPICAAVADIVEGRLSIDEAIAGLLSRPLRPEFA